MKEYHNYRNTKGQFVVDPAKRSQQAMEELYRAFDFFNKRFAEGRLPKVIITVQESGRKNAYGWFGNKFWSDGVCNNGVSEINLSAEYMGRDPLAILETLLHEMAHLFNAQHDIRDVTSGQYHNKHFKSAAIKFGLNVSRVSNRGYARTELNADGESAIKELKPNTEVLSSLRRKKVKRNIEKRYVSLIVDAAYESQITRGMELTGLTQKQFVEQAIEELVGTLEDNQQLETVLNER